MALIYCPECGKEVSDRAASCPNCGCPMATETLTNASFCLQRNYKGFLCAVRYDVFLDNQLWGVLKNGDSLSASLPCGTHHLRINDKNNHNKTVYESDFILGNENLTFSFSAATKLKMNAASSPVAIQTNNYQPQFSNNYSRTTPTYIPHPAAENTPPARNRCPRCGGFMTIQTISEERKSGCFTVLLYILLALTLLGLLIVIPLMLRRKTETVTYTICQNCGYKKRLS